ncbi:hypothetical protein ACTFIW_000058 [Dictyostelium discoideum]
MENYILFKKIFNNKYLFKKIFEYVQYRDTDQNEIMKHYKSILNTKSIHDLSLSGLLKKKQYKLFDYMFDFLVERMESINNFENEINNNKNNNNNKNYNWLFYSKTNEEDFLEIFSYKDLGLERFKRIFKLYVTEIIIFAGSHFHESIINSGNIEIINFMSIFKNNKNNNNNNNYNKNYFKDFIKFYITEEKNNLFDCNNNLEIFDLILNNLNQKYEKHKKDKKDKKDNGNFKISDCMLILDYYIKNKSFNLYGRILNLSDQYDRKKLIEKSLTNNDYELAIEIINRFPNLKNENPNLKFYLLDYSFKIKKNIFTDKSFKVFNVFFKEYNISKLFIKLRQTPFITDFTTVPITTLNLLLVSKNLKKKDDDGDDENVNYIYQFKIWEHLKDERIDLNNLYQEFSGDDVTYSNSNGCSVKGVLGNYYPNSIEELEFSLNYSTLNCNISPSNILYIHHIAFNIADLELIKLYTSKFTIKNQTYPKDIYKCFFRTTSEISSYFSKDENLKNFVFSDTQYFLNTYHSSSNTTSLGGGGDTTMLQSNYTILNVVHCLEVVIEKGYFEIYKNIIPIIGKEFIEPKKHDHLFYSIIRLLIKSIIKLDKMNQLELIEYTLDHFDLSKHLKYISIQQIKFFNFKLSKNVIFLLYSKGLISLKTISNDMSKFENYFYNDYHFFYLYFFGDNINFTKVDDFSTLVNGANSKMVTKILIYSKNYKIIEMLTQSDLLITNEILSKSLEERGRLISILLDTDIRKLIFIIRNSSYKVLKEYYSIIVKKVLIKKNIKKKLILLNLFESISSPQILKSTTITTVTSTNLLSEFYLELIFYTILFAHSTEINIEICKDLNYYNFLNIEKNPIDVHIFSNYYNNNFKTISKKQFLDNLNNLPDISINFLNSIGLANLNKILLN